VAALSTALDRGVIETLERRAALRRLPGSPGEREAAELLAAELASRGARVEVERERVHGTYWVPIGLASGLAATVGLASRAVPGFAGRVIGAAWLAPWGSRWAASPASAECGSPVPL
jgi:hypothetical protein